MKGKMEEQQASGGPGRRGDMMSRARLSIQASGRAGLSNCPERRRNWIKIKMKSGINREPMTNAGDVPSQNAIVKAQL